MTVPFRRVLCAVDGSPTSEEALVQALRLAREYDADLHVVHCWQPSPGALPEGISQAWDEVNRATRNEKAERFGHWVDGIAPHAQRLHCHFLEGRAADVIPATARELGADVIVAGTHGRRGLARLMIGSVAEAIVRASTVPVLLIPRRARVAA